LTTPQGPRTEPRSTDRAAEELPEALSVAAHDVAEALRVAEGYLELLTGHAAERLDDAGRRYLAGIGDGLGHVDRVMQGVLAYVRAAVDPLEIEAVDVNAALEDALAGRRAVLEQRAASVDIGDLPDVQADGRALRTVLGNLLDNALTFAGDAPPRVEVTAARDGAGWRVTVADRGIGLPAEERERVLAPFTRGHPRSLATGPGLGLAVARLHAERRGGRLWLEAADGGGTAACLTIPDQAPAA
jgi:two-component system, chemotaxis family, sensor kinase Cph1